VGWVTYPKICHEKFVLTKRQEPAQPEKFALQIERVPRVEEHE